MTADIFIKDGIEIRRFKSGRCVPEDEWKQFVQLNEPLYLSYMLRNEPFEKLPLSYRPVQKFDHYPPRLSFGIVIPEEFAQFRQVALENHLGDPEELRTAKNFFELQTLVMPFLNERCGLSRGEAMICGHIHSLEGALVLEMQTNYRGRVPREKADNVVRVIKEVFHLPDDTKPKWYLEGDIDLKESDEFLLPMSLLFEWSGYHENIE